MKNKRLLFSLALFFAITVAHSQPRLNSYAQARATIYLDFDGETVTSMVWNGGNTIVCAAAALNNTQINEIFNRVAEDYRPFEINITTDLNVFLAAPADSRMRVIITPTSFFAGVGGVAYAGSFKWGDDTPCFVFCDKLGPNNPKMVAECCSHESGHTLGLSHQSKYDAGCNLTATYNDGTGNGETAWAPIMGNSYYRNMSGWNNGPTPYGCSNMQDNLSIITTQNGFGYRADDYSDNINVNPFHIGNSDVTGIISTSTDKDAFTFTLTHNSNVSINAKPFSVNANNDGADLDINLSLYDAAKNLIRTYNPAGIMSATIDTILTAGVYYLVVDGSGNNNTSDYGSLGSYTLSGLFGVLPVCNINFNGRLINNQHEFGWAVSCNEDITGMELQASADGVHFAGISNFSGAQRGFSYIPQGRSDIYYRLKVVSLSGNITYSFTILLKAATGKTGFVVANLVSSELLVRAPGNFSYRLLSVNGAVLSHGSGFGGINNIPVSGLAAGNYILLLEGCGLRQTSRVLKL